MENILKRDVTVAKEYLKFLILSLENGRKIVQVNADLQEGKKTALKRSKKR